MEVAMVEEAGVNNIFCLASSRLLYRFYFLFSFSSDEVEMINDNPVKTQKMQQMQLLTAKRFE